MRLASENGDGNPRARIVNVQRMSTDDGPGLRTTVFLKGCSLACVWCHNPESLASTPEIVCHEWKCIDCDACDEVCPHGALSHDEQGVRIDRSLCKAGTICVEGCPTTALERIGEERDLDELVAEVAKDRAFYDSSGGGVTVSGGEPAMQPGFVAAFLRACRSIGIHTALDTAGLCSAHSLAQIAGEADLVLYDLKEIDSERHSRYTDHPNEGILANACRLAEQVRRGPRPTAVWIRTPLIPGYTATVDNVSGIGRFIAYNLRDVVARWELCAFNNLAADKYRRLNRIWPFAGVGLLSEEELRVLEGAAHACGVAPEIVAATGRVRIECASNEAVGA